MGLPRCSSSSSSSNICKKLMLQGTRYVKLVPLSIVVARQEHLTAMAQAVDVMIFGDSITEAFRGTTQSHDDPTWDFNRMEFERLIGSQYKAAVCSIAGQGGITRCIQVCHTKWAHYPGVAATV